VNANELDILQILLNSGFVVKFVLILLIICSVYSWAVIFNKYKDLKKSMSEDLSFIEKFNLESALNLAELSEETGELSKSSLRKMFKEGFSELKRMQKLFENDESKARFKEFFTGHGLEAIDRSLKKGANQANHHLEIRLSSLASIGSVAPFIGLFGTVWGIIDAFTGLASGGGSIEAVAPGIAEALVATAVGLAAAIPAVWGYNYFLNKITSINKEMENFGQDFINYVEKQVWSVKDN